MKGQDIPQGTSSSPIVQSVRIFGFHPEDPGSIPGGGVTFAFFDNLQLFNILATQIGKHEKTKINNLVGLNSRYRLLCRITLEKSQGLHECSRKWQISYVRA